MTSEPTDTGVVTTREGVAHPMNRVPEVTLYFWLVKVLCTTVGDTFTDDLGRSLGIGRSGTTLVIGLTLCVLLGLQFRARRYVPWIYWTTVALISVLATLVTDGLGDGRGIPTSTTTALFAALLAITFATWYAVERTLSIHTIRTPRRETFYWLAILFTFVLGAAGGDLVSERPGLGPLAPVLVFAGAIVVVCLAHWGLGVGTTLTFWVAFLLTRPLGASLGDYLSQSRQVGALGLGANATSVIFLGAVLAVVAFVTITRTDVTDDEAYDATSVAVQPRAAPQRHR